MAENTFEVRVGRLVEVRVAKGFANMEELEQMHLRVRQRMSSLPPDFRSITVADWRLCTVLPGAVAEHMLKMWIQANPTTVRSALLHSQTSPTAVMQFIRLVRDSAHPNRRLFHDSEEMAAWLGEVLTAEESARLRVFLGLPRSRPPGP